MLNKKSSPYASQPLYCQNDLNRHKSYVFSTNKTKKKINRKNKYIKLNMNTGAKPVKAENTLTFSPLSDGK